MRLAARVCTLLLLLLPLAYCLLPIQAHAQYTNPYIAPNTDANVPANLHTYTQTVIMEVLSGFTCQIIGIDPMTTSHQCLGFNPTTGRIGYISSNGGAVGFVGSMIASLYTPPINTGGYFRSVASNFGLVKHTYAASSPNGSSANGCSGNGCGFDQLTPLLGLWTTFRNISYAVFVLIFIGIGFAIMLRVKIDPRTVMTIENQIPKIIIGLILVTFSYAIAGFLIDMMYVSIYLETNIITASQSSRPDTVKQIQNTEKSDLTGGNPFGFANDIIPGGLVGISAGSAGSVHKLIQDLFTPAKDQTPSSTSSNTTGNGWQWGTAAGVGVGAGCLILSPFTFGASIIPCLLLGAGVGAASGIVVNNFNVGDVVDAALGTLIGWVAGILAFLIIAIALLIALFRVWFGLLLAYISILLDVILAPFFIIAGVFPGSKVGFGMWLRDIGSNLLAFPVTIGMFLLAGVFMNNFLTNTTNVFVPPLIGNPNGGSGQSPIAYLVALGMLLLTPSVVSIMRELLKAPKNQYLQAIAGNLGAGVAPLGIATKSIIAYNQKDLLGKSRMGFRGVLQVLGL